MNKSEGDSELTQKQPCLVCGVLYTNLKRGLCTKHYQQFRRRKECLKPDAAEQWELLLIEEGKLLPKQQGKKFGVDDPFGDSFSAFIASQPDAVKDESKTAPQILDSAITTTTEHRKKPKP